MLPTNNAIPPENWSEELKPMNHVSSHQLCATGALRCLSLDRETFAASYICQFFKERPT